VPKVVDHEAQRADITQRCIELFARRGHADLAVRDIANELGVSTGTLYHYFPNKDDLFESVVDAVVDQDIVHATATVKKTIADRRLRLRAILRYVVASSPRLATLYRVLIDFAWQPGRDGRRWQEQLHKARRSYAVAVADILEIDDAAKIDLVILVIAGLIKRALIGDFSTEITGIADNLDHILFEEP
jgi:AcrR family transcriptional regulator